MWDKVGKEIGTYTKIDKAKEQEYREMTWKKLLDATWADIGDVTWKDWVFELIALWNKVNKIDSGWLVYGWLVYGWLLSPWEKVSKEE